MAWPLFVVSACRPATTPTATSTSPSTDPAATVAATTAPTARRPDILLISIDTLRADRLGCYGRADAHTPTIDRLAAEGAAFEHAWTPVPITLPAHATMLTGLLPPRHGVRDNGSFRLPDTHATLAESLRAAGYRTGAFVGGFPLVAAGGLARGFDVYDDEMSPHAFGSGAQEVSRLERSADEVLQRAWKWLLAAPAESPVFAFVHLYDPHSPYERPLPGRQELSYEGEIAYVDAVLGEFFAALRRHERWNGLLTILTSDHGEGLGEHGERTHCIFVYDTTLRIPLIVHWPGRLDPMRIASPAGLIDVTPTILKLAGLPPIAGVDGQALLSESGDGVTIVDASPPDAAARSFYAESLFPELRFGWAPLRSLRQGALKYIDAPRPELFDVAVDPSESNNLVEARPQEAARLARQLRGMGDGVRAAVAESAQTRSALGALGYLSAPPADDAEAASPADPKDRMAAYNQFELAHEYCLTGRIDEALAALASVESQFARSPYFHQQLGEFAARAGRWAEAEASFRRCLELSESNLDVRLNLGVAQMRQGDYRAAAAQFDRILSIDPNHAVAHLYAGVVKGKHLGDEAGAVRHWSRFVELAPHHPEADKIRAVLDSQPAGRTESAPSKTDSAP